VVTGASAGVGRATAVAFGRAGWSVGLLARGEAGLDAAVKEVGGRALAVPTDVADADAVEAAAQRIEDELGPIDAWVNDAMTTVFAWSWDITADEFRRATEVTYLGQVNGTMAALRRMRPRDRGVVCNVGSALAYRAIPLQSAYCGAKFAVRGFTEAVRCELRHEGSNVQLTEVHLPAVNTPQFTWCLNRLPKRPQPVPPVYAPEVAAERIVLAVSEPRRDRVLGGFNRFLILANKVSPRLADRYVARTAVASQQTDEPAGDDPVDLWAPVDATGDHGARGPFRGQEGGMRNPTWWLGVPKMFVDLVRG
jgi:NAD(P)-dependent dehydrogenase (short-subunit alcohol dehydrogenase family)